jgi:hypothetical protein
MSEKVFQGTITYLKGATLMGMVACILSIIFVGIDPWHSLDGLIWMDLYGTPTLPKEAEPAFALAFLLFSWLSILTMMVVFLVAKYALVNREKWAYWVVVLMGTCWPMGGALITWYTKAWSYGISVAMMTILFFPPVVLLYPHFFKKGVGQS